VVDADCEPDLPDSDSIRVLRTSGGVGPSMARHIGVSSAKGDVIALVDDDDVWRPHKLEKQLAAAPPGHEWIVSCRFVVHEGGRKPITRPHTLIRPDESIAPYMFQVRSPRRRQCRWLGVPTMVFPREVAQRVPWSVAADPIHDDAKWVIEVQRALPNLRIIQLPEPLVDIIFTPGSLSRSGIDRSAEYIDWGIRELADESRRVRGDYMLTNPASSALAVGSFGGVARSIVAGVRSGRPGVWAWVYAIAAIMRIGWRRVRNTAAGVAERL
jgi:glycosyltransferase involved in cell wall biosynthesis